MKTYLLKRRWQDLATTRASNYLVQYQIKTKAIKHVAILDLIYSFSFLNFVILAVSPVKPLYTLKNNCQETSLPLFKERKKFFVRQNI